MNTGLLATVALLFTAVFLTGFRLKRSGKPYGVVVFTCHKLAGLGALVVLARSVYLRNQLTARSRVEWTVSVVTALLFVTLIASGGLLSIERPMPGVISRIHKALPYLALLATAGFLFLAS